MDIFQGIPEESEVLLHIGRVKSGPARRESRCLGITAGRAAGKHHATHQTNNSQGANGRSDDHQAGPIVPR